MQLLPIVWDLVKQFKRRCRLLGWWVSQYDDIIYVNGEYHNLLCAKRVYPKTFRVIARSHFHPLRENDMLYRLVNISYTAWIFQEKPHEDIFVIVAENENLRKHMAIYDLSETYSGRPICMKINETKSIVFQEFERFLKSEYHINMVNKLFPLRPERTI